MTQVNTQNLIASTKYDFFKLKDLPIKLLKSDTLTIKSGTTTFFTEDANGSVEHGMGFAPFFKAYYREANASRFIPIPDNQSFFSGSTYLGLVGVTSAATDKKLFFTISSTRTSVPLVYPIYIKYFIYNVSLND